MTERAVPQLKVCGITNLSDAQATLNVGADWLGLIAVPGTPRFMDASSAKKLVEDLRVDYPKAYVVGVFQDASPEEVEAYAKLATLSAIQLHGQENPAHYARIGLPIIKVLHLDSQVSMADLQLQAAHYLQQTSVMTCLLDLPKGSGLRSIQEWSDFHRLPELIADVPCMVAGGLNPENIEPVLKALSPWGVDVASGVEQVPGKKDWRKLNEFCRRVKRPENQLSDREINPTSIGE